MFIVQQGRFVQLSAAVSVICEFARIFAAHTIFAQCLLFAVLFWSNHKTRENHSKFVSIISCSLKTMSIHLKLDNIDFDQAKESHIKLQYIPASIDEATPTNIDQFFNNYTTEKDGCEYSLLPLGSLLFILCLPLTLFWIPFVCSFEKFIAWFPIERLSIQSARNASRYCFPGGPTATGRKCRTHFQSSRHFQ